MPKSNTYKSNVLNLLTKNTAISNPPTKLFLALYHTNPGDSDTGTEASYVGYNRQEVTWGSTQLANSTAYVQNQNELKFGVVPSAALDITHAGLRTALSGGDLVYYGPLATSYKLSQGVQPIVPTNSLTVTES